MGRPIPPGTGGILPMRVPAPPRRTPPSVPLGVAPRVLVPPVPPIPIVLPPRKVR